MEEDAAVMAAHYSDMQVRGVCITNSTSVSGLNTPEFCECLVHKYNAGVGIPIRKAAIACLGKYQANTLAPVDLNTADLYSQAEKQEEQDLNNNFQSGNTQNPNLPYNQIAGEEDVGLEEAQTTNTQPSEIPTPNRFVLLARTLGGGIAIALGIAALVGGLLGWLLVMRKKVLKCSYCGSITNVA